MRIDKLCSLALTSMLVTVGIVFVSGLSSAAVHAQGGDVTRGAQLYAKNCATCHGERAEGRVGARLAKDFPGIRVDALLKETISNGVQGSVMPAWAKAKGGPLTDPEIDDIVAFIRSLGHQAPTVLPGPTATSAPVPSPVATYPPGNAQRGASIYSRDCALCHGDKGEGRIGATLQKDFPGINPVGYIEATVARGVGGSKMPAWAKSNGGPLTDQEIADVSEYVRTLRQPGQPGPSQPTELPAGGIWASPLALVCAGLVVLIGVIVLGIGLVGSRSRNRA